jgi:hypothetical protein
MTNGCPVAYVVYKFNEETVVDGLRIRNANDWWPNVRAPKDWTFEGSNDGENWFVLDTRSGETGWTAGEVRDYRVANKIAYEYYKFNCTANNGDPGMVSIMELQFLQGGVVGLTTVTSGGVTSSSAGHYDYPARKAFDGVTNSSAGRWLATKGSDMFLVYKFNEPTMVNAISLLTPGNASGYGYDTPARSPKDWTFLGSNDGVNWKTLDEQTGETGWETNKPEERYYEFVNNKSYQYYKFNCTANNGATDYLQLMEMEFYYHNTGLPGLDECGLVRESATSYTLSGTLVLNDADAISYIVSDGATVTTNSFATDVSEGDTATGTISGLDTGKTYQVSVLAVNAVGGSVTEVGSVYTGDLVLGATSDASEATGEAGTVAVSRANPDPLPLTVYYTIIGTVGTEGVTWKAPVAVTIPAGETTGYLLVTPLVDLGVDDDVEVTVALAAGNYGVPAEGNSATLTIANGGTPAGYEILTITNALDKPAGGFYSPAYATITLTNQTNKIISFVKPEEAPKGLREFAQTTVNQWTYIGSGDVNVTRDWMLAESVSKPSAASTVQSIDCTTDGGAITGLKARQDVRTYMGSWYIPANGTYSFRMRMAHVGLFSLDGKRLLRQIDNNAVTTNNVALTAGWHSFYAAFATSDGNSGSKIGPAKDESLGFSFSAENAELTTASPGTAFSNANCQFSTAFSTVLIPSMWAVGGDVIIDCANVLGDLRVTGQIGSPDVGSLDLDHKFKFVNIPAGGTLEVGRPASNTLTGWQGLSEFAYVDWTRVEVPSGVSVRFEGAFVVDSSWTTAGRGVWSDGDHSAFSFGGNAILFVDVPNFFGTLTDEFHYPDGLYSLHVARPEVLGDTAKIFVPTYSGFGFGGAPFSLKNGAIPIDHVAATKFRFLNDVELGTGAAINKTLTSGVGDDRLVGNVDGTNGSVRITGYSSYMKFSGSVVTKDAIVQQLACRTSFLPKAGSEPSAILGTLTLGSGLDSNGVGNETKPYPTGSWDYCGPHFCYCPETPGEHPLYIYDVLGQCAEYYPQNVGPNSWKAYTHMTRAGANLSTCSNSTINVGTLRGQGIHLRSTTPFADTQGFDEYKYEKGTGFANFVIGKINGAHTHKEGSVTVTDPMRIFVSSNVNVTVTNIAKVVDFHYEVMSNGVNAAFLDIEDSTAAGVAGSTITATDVAMLPGRIRGFTGNITLTDTTEGRTYDVVYDFDRGVAIGGCDGSGNLVAAPSTGTIRLSFVGTPTKGKFGVLRFDNANGLLGGWDISAPPRYEGLNVTVCKDANGFSFSMHHKFSIHLR